MYKYRVQHKIGHSSVLWTELYPHKVQGRLSSICLTIPYGIPSAQCRPALVSRPEAGPRALRLRTLGTNTVRKSKEVYIRYRIFAIYLFYKR